MAQAWSVAELLRLTTQDLAASPAAQSAFAA